MSYTPWYQQSLSRPVSVWTWTRVYDHVRARDAAALTPRARYSTLASKSPDRTPTLLEFSFWGHSPRTREEVRLKENIWM